MLVEPIKTVSESKKCVHCLANIRFRPDSIPYETSVCSKCLKSREEYEEYRKILNRLKQQRYYQKHREKEKVRQAEIYRRKRKK
jgi:hypothetical protein